MNNAEAASQGRTLLIVDDDAANMGVITDYLETFDLRILTALDGQDALETVRAARPDLILLDVVMPGLDGWEVCRRLKAEPATCEIPVIFMTALASTEDKLTGFEVGGVDYVTKPVRQEELLARVMAHLKIRQLTQGLQAQNARLERMASELEGLYRQTARFNEDLEQVVHRRTQELEHANRDLASEVAKRKQAEEQIAARLREREVLLGELHDRIKNNLQVIISLHHLQEKYIQDEQALRAFRESQRRIRAMAFVHEQFYQSPDMARIDLAGYVRRAVRDLMCRYGLDSDTVKVKMEVHDVFLGLRAAVPCGLLINELVSNCMRHAFSRQEERKEDGNEIWVEMRPAQVGHGEKGLLPSRYVLIVSDNGIGLPEGLNFRNTDSLGLQLVVTLVNQLNGEIELDRSRGTTFKITFAE